MWPFAHFCLKKSRKIRGREEVLELLITKMITGTMILMTLMAIMAAIMAVVTEAEETSSGITGIGEIVWTSILT